MLKIYEITKQIENYFATEESENIERYKIFIRMDLALDVNLVVKNKDIYNVDYFKKQIDCHIGDDLSLESFNVNIKVYSFEEYTNDEYVSCLFPQEKASVKSGPRYSLNTFFDEKHEELKLKSKVPIVTFYSYKGGMGRTTTMISYAIDLAINRNKSVFIIDCDLEAPGYLNFFDLSKHSGLTSGKCNGLVEFLCDCQFSKKTSDIDINDYTINVAYGNDDDSAQSLGNIYIMPAGNLNERISDDSTLGGNVAENAWEEHVNRKEYLEGLSRLNLADEWSLTRGFQILVDKINKAYEPDIILIDSRTGFNDIIGTSVLYLSNSVVGFFGYNEQTVPGLLNLIDCYYKNSFDLSIVSSILPKDGYEELVVEEKKNLHNYIMKNGDLSSLPVFFEMHRNEKLELLGTEKFSNKEYIEFIKSKEFQDYVELFDHLSSVFYNEEPAKDKENDTLNTSSSSGVMSSKKTKTIDLRNTILRNLKTTLQGINSFAESTNIKSSTFFYRKCMNEFFEEKKFMVIGYKGTGKTYLYKALADPKMGKISQTIIKRANAEREDGFQINYDPKFIDVISIDNDNSFVKKMFPFKLLSYASIEDYEYYFNSFWQIHTWLSVMLDKDFEDIKNESKLSEYVRPFDGNEAVKRFDDLIHSGIGTLIEIENDLEKVNEQLAKENKKLFLLYDQLDTRINPKNWEKVVSPLIDYWREKCCYYSNITPKIFIRTDLLSLLRGTNTVRLKDNIINIEWTIEEIFAYFFKLVFSNKTSADCFWQITDRVGINKEWVRQTKDGFATNDNQFKTLRREQMQIAVNIFFGDVLSSNNRRTRAWDYFQSELSNADGKSISMRPFINTLDRNAIEIALRDLIKYGYVKEIMNSKIYASRDVRIKAANDYFDDLTKDEALQDLRCFKDFINCDKGAEYRFKTLDEKTFNSLINTIYEDNKEILRTVNGQEDIKRLLFACGVMAEHITRGGKLYAFAPMYHYAWGLRSSVNDDVISRRMPYSAKAGSYSSTGIIEFDGSEYHCGEYALNEKRVVEKGHLGCTISFSSKNIKENKNYNSIYTKYISKYDVI